MTKRKRRNHSPRFKGKVALAATRAVRTLSELAEQFDVHPKQIQDRKKRLMSGVEEVFGECTSSEGTELEAEKLHAKIGQLAMEKEFWRKRSVATGELVPGNDSDTACAFGDATMRAARRCAVDGVLSTTSGFGRGS